MRKNPLQWDDEAPQGVLSPFEGYDDLCSSNTPSLLGMPGGEGLLRTRDVRPDLDAGPAVQDMLAQTASALKAAAGQGRGWRRRVDQLNDTDRSVLYDALGQGEVSMAISGAAPGEGTVSIQETVLPGVWIGRAEDENAVIRTEWIEVADAPRALREAASVRPRSDIAIDALSPPDGAMNVMSVIAEVQSRARDWKPGTPNHVINFTLFPMTPVDTAFLAKVLGEVGVRISSGGYGTARVIMTALKNVWAVQYLNRIGTVILDTIEIGNVPSAVLASLEDFEDSAERLAEIQEVYVQ